MNTILLAAGIGQRLGENSGGKPKCLLEFDGITLLRRHLDILLHYDIRNVAIVTGYCSDLIEQEISRSPAAKQVKIIINSDYKKGSIISMLMGLQSQKSEDSLILMDADVLYDHRIFGKLIETTNPDCFLLDRDFIPGDEPVKLCVRNGRIIEFRKKIADDLQYDFQGESVGFFRFTKNTVSKLVQSAEQYLAQGKDNLPYEECIRDLLLISPDLFAYEDITGLNWLEIDFPEDVARAKKEILPKLVPLNLQ